MRKLEPSDVDAVYEIFSHPEVTRYFDVNLMTQRSDAQTFIQQTIEGSQNGTLLQWGIIESDTNRLIGTCAFVLSEPKTLQAEIGFALHHDLWGLGYMKEWLSVFILFGLKSLDFDTLKAEVDPRNLASIALLEHFAFEPVKNPDASDSGLHYVFRADRQGEP